jgi:hypothetical protein
MAKRPAYPNHVGTIGGTMRMGHGLWVHCNNRECLHRARVDLEAIAGAGAMDVMDNGSALPTGPQPQKQTQPLAA